MFDDIIYIIGQALGIVAVILGLLCFQMKNAKGILVFQITIASVFALHYLCLGAYTAVAVNVLAAFQNVCYYFRNKKGSRSLLLPIIFTSLVVVVSLLTWDSWQCIFLMTGVAVGAVSLALSSAQNIRFAMFIKCPLCLIYNALVFSVGGVLYESASLLSSVIGTVKYYSDKKKTLMQGEKKNG